jgi:hypothetical protein
MKYLLLLSIAILLNGWNHANALTNPDLGDWNIFILKTKLKNKFSFVGEINFRSEKLIKKFNYGEYKGSILYSMNKNIGFSLGAGGFNKNSEDGFFLNSSAESEFRTWVDFLLLKHSTGRFNFEHRGRMEQRFIPSDYQNRLRYRLQLNLPVNHTKMSDKTIFLSAYNEFFVGENDPHWEKNKFWTAAGYRVNENFSFQMGNVIMTDIKKQSKISKNYLVFMIVYNLTGKNHHS